MAKYLRNITSYNDLKTKYRDLLKANHPDNGGNLEVMQEINAEYDALFKIWKDRAAKDNTLTEEEKTETAQSTKRTFYSQTGWEGSRYDSSMSLKQISKIVKNYTKEKYPTCKFSVRTHYASMCQELTVDLLEFPEKMYKTADDLRNEGLNETHSYTKDDGTTRHYEVYKNEISELVRKLSRNDYLGDSWTDDELLEQYTKACESNPSFFGIKAEYFQAVIADVEDFVNSYNYEDIDSMTDYFNVHFYFLGLKYSHCAYVPKVARISKQETRPKATQQEQTQEQPAIEQGESNFTVEESEHTKTHEKIYLVKCLVTLSRDNYMLLNNLFKQNGGYYSKFTHSFIFKSDPSEFLKGVKIA
jgi:curved DNA-binding protein CbpA